MILFNLLEFEIIVVLRIYRVRLYLPFTAGWFELEKSLSKLFSLLVMQFIKDTTFIELFQLEL
jgi:hypothetical protein